MDWTYLAQDTEKWWAAVTAMVQCLVVGCCDCNGAVFSGGLL